MQVITSIEAKALIPSVTREEAIQYLISVNEHTDELSVNSFYLGHLCACGKLNEAAAFIESLGAGATEVINFSHNRFYMGTVLHVAMNWNTGELGKEFFTLLWEHGAEYVQDYYDQYPWEQFGKIWVNPLDNSFESKLGIRDDAEFIEMYEQLQETYDLPFSEFNPENVQPEQDSETDSDVEEESQQIG
jgi:hypothetical protein